MSDTRFARLELLLGAESLRRLGEASVLVAGLGAVGSMAAEALARCGVGHLRLADDDRVEPSNINRQLHALESTVGRPKASLAAARIGDINPACRAEALATRVGAATLPALLDPPPRLVVDAIDTVRDKVSLLAACVRGGIPVVAAMGAARRRDPLAVRIGRLDEARACPLARAVRKGLAAAGVTAAGIRCVYSAEAPQAAPDAGGGASPKALGSIICVTGVFGLLAAWEAIRILLDDGGAGGGRR